MVINLDTPTKFQYPLSKPVHPHLEIDQSNTGGATYPALEDFVVENRLGFDGIED